MFFYLDESGDQSFTFDKPFRQGGSSRYLTIFAVEVPEAKTANLRNLVDQMHQHYNPDVIGREGPGEPCQSEHPFRGLPRPHLLGFLRRRGHRVRPVESCGELRAAFLRKECLMWAAENS